MQFIDFRNIKNSSKILKDFKEECSAMLDFFPNNTKSKHHDYFQRLSAYIFNRDAAKNAIVNSMSILNKSNAQLDNLDKISEPNTFFVITGQQAGLFGGASYTAYKIASAVARANQLNKIYEDYNFVPLFWLEDNDHDAKEAGEIYLADSFGEVRKFSVYSDEMQKMPVSMLHFDESINELVENAANLLPYSENKESIAELLRQIYTPNKSWGDATIELYHHLFERFGLLFAKASVCREMGLFGSIALENIKSDENIENLNNILNNSIGNVSKLGYNLSVSSEKLNYCLHTGGQRYVVKQDGDKFIAGDRQLSIEEMRQLLTLNPQNVSPKALLRPIFQDMIFPNATAILGPGEISYYSALKEVYQFFGIEIPPIEMRMSLTFLLDKQKEFLERNQLSINYFLRDISEIEQDLSNMLQDEASELQFELSKELIAKAYETLKGILIEAEPSLERTADAFAHKSIDSLETLNKKYISAKKKKNSELIQKYRRLKNFIYQNNMLQERYFSPIVFLNLYGTEKYVNILRELADNGIKEHIIY